MRFTLAFFIFFRNTRSKASAMPGKRNAIPTGNYQPGRMIIAGKDNG